VQPRKAIAAAIVRVAAIPILIILGCADSTPPTVDKPSIPDDTLAGKFNPQNVGAIGGVVTWKGDVPNVEPFNAPISPQVELRGGEWLEWPNPNVPVIDRMTKGVGNAVVFLRRVDPQFAKPWSYPPVRVEQRAYQLHVMQGETDGQVGFVHRGDGVEMVSPQDAFHSLRAGGAAFFTLAFPDPDQPLTRTFKQNGVVELTSGAGYFWMRAYLFVDEHPYYCRTDSQGRFKFDQVPAGRYDIVCWMPNWHKHGHDRDPETTLFSRWYFAAPLESKQVIEVRSGEAVNVDFSISAGLFAPS
jgi:hypothetical protein